MNRIRQMFGDELAGRIFAAAYERQEDELHFVRRIVEDGLRDRTEPQTCYFILAVILASALVLSFSRIIDQLI
jgi:hypothetical protein